MCAHPLGRDAALIGEVIEDDHIFVQMETAFGGRRIVDLLKAGVSVRPISAGHCLLAEGPLNSKKPYHNVQIEGLRAFAQSRSNVGLGQL